MITYPLARELFAFAIRELRVVKSDQIYIRASWTAAARKTSCKNFVDDYNATPSLKGSDRQKEKLKSALGFGGVGGLLALINISRTVPEINLLRNN